MQVLLIIVSHARGWKWGWRRVGGYLGVLQATTAACAKTFSSTFWTTPGAGRGLGHRGLGLAAFSPEVAGCVEGWGLPLEVISEALSC